jgi:hypothetical protein
MSKSDAIAKDTPELYADLLQGDLTLAKLYASVCARQNSLNEIMAKNSPMHWAAAATIDHTHRDEGYKLNADGNVAQVFTDYRTAALDEAFELFRSAVPFKWWGDLSAQKVDRENCIVECVDILHFLASEAMRIGTPYSQKKGVPLSESVLFYSGRMIANGLAKGHRIASQPNSGYFLKDSVLQLISGMYTSTLETQFVMLGEVLAALRVTPEEFAGFYFLKATLNTFRTRKFKAGVAYKKVWADGREDNAHLFEYATRYLGVYASLPDDLPCMEFLESSCGQ